MGAQNEDSVMVEHVGAAMAARLAAKHEVDRIVAREGGAPYPYAAQRRATQNALLVLGWDATAARVAAEEDDGLDAVASGLSLSATRATNTPAYRDRARAAMIEVMALEALVTAQPRGKQ